jgi:hypothetical protein
LRTEELRRVIEFSDVELRRQRAARNQSLFREVNERIEDLAGSASFPTFICECMDETCDATISVSVEEYERVRRGSNRFLVLPGHEERDLEEIVDSTDRFLVVSKLGSGATVAERLDPRRRPT